MTVPNFLILGSQKAGTTSLYHVLRLHPEIYMSDTKEVNFFFYENKFQQGLSYYKTFFKSAPSGINMIGEASPGYICHPLVPERIQQYLPKVKRFIITVRNPINRAYSQFSDNLRHLEAKHDFGEAFDLALSDTYEPGKLGYFSRGTYIQYIERYVERFGRENILVLIFEDLKKDPLAFYRQCFEFLGVDPDFRCPEMTQKFNASNVWSNPAYQWFLTHPRHTRFLNYHLRQLLCRGKQTPYEASMNPEIREKLIEFYKPWNKKLAKFLDRNLDDWNK